MRDHGMGPGAVVVVLGVASVRAGAMATVGVWSLLFKSKRRR